MKKLNVKRETLNVKRKRFRDRIIRYTLHVTLLTIFVIRLNASFDYQGKTARDEGMANTYVAMADDAGSLFHNVAGLVHLQRPELITNYGQLHMGLGDGNLSQSLAAFAMPLKKMRGGFGIGWSGLSLDETYNEDLIELGYTVKVTSGTSVGVGIKNMGIRYGEDLYTAINPVFKIGNSKSAMGVDIGIMNNVGDSGMGEGYRFGVSLMNVNRPDLGIKYESRMPMEGKIGINFYSWYWNMGGELDYKEGDGVTASIGGERWMMEERLALRGGVRFGVREYRKVSLGMSYGDTWYRVNYAFIYPLSSLQAGLGTHKIDFAVYMGRKTVSKEEKEVLRRLEAESFEVSPEVKTKVAGLVEDARSEMDRGKFGKAEEMLKDAEKIWKDNAEVRVLLGRIGPAALMYPDIEEKDHKSRLVRGAIIAYTERRGKESLNRIRYASQLWPDDRDILQMRLVIEKEFTELAAGEKLVPGLNLIEQKLQQALEYIYDGKFVSAITQCEEVLDLEPRSVLGFMRLGSAYWAMGNTSKARGAWREALKYDPKNEQLLKFLQMKEKGAPGAAPKEETPKEKAKEPVKKTEAAPGTQERFDRAVQYYRKLVTEGAAVKVRKMVLERLIEKFKDEGADLSYVEEELKKLK